MALDPIGELKAPARTGESGGNDHINGGAQGVDGHTTGGLQLHRITHPLQLQAALGLERIATSAGDHQGQAAVIQGHPSRGGSHLAGHIRRADH